MLAVAALYVSGLGLRGLRAEHRANKAGISRQEKEKYETDAKTFNAMAGLAKGWVLGVIFVASIIQLCLALMILF